MGCTVSTPVEPFVDTAPVERPRPPAPQPAAKVTPTGPPPIPDLDVPEQDEDDAAEEAIQMQARNDTDDPHAEPFPLAKVNGHDKRFDVFLSHRQVDAEVREST